MEKEYGSEKEALGYSPGLLRVLSWEEQSAWDTRGRTQVGGGGGGETTGILYPRSQKRTESFEKESDQHPGMQLRGQERLELRSPLDLVTVTKFVGWKWVEK